MVMLPAPARCSISSPTLAISIVSRIPSTSALFLDPRSMPELNAAYHRIFFVFIGKEEKRSIIRGERRNNLVQEIEIACIG
ncbi:hypothetical protein BO85DRAFT_244897 [Aspergillus piperis CBS 112811]|uniref:Uncharacterized protein n=1 Tax=Aspergillus piperis CBS 112811 TaxID=1448313 RepID=A0A8G1R884_9EURO|nr:hypothetical protein BO85DRAFT_244897 [Aspergillus piperis CBS 112811]RAH59550.1 hypothetical protein BO85DRAFT_244897 [Aspergillus piperis CBS 112811]